MTCRVYEVDGQPVRVQGDKPMDEKSQAALAEVVRAVHALMAAEPRGVQAEREAKQVAAQARIAARVARLGGTE